MDRGCRGGEAPWREPDSTGTAAGVRGLRKRVENQAKPKAKSKESEPPSFLEFVAPGAKPVTNCTVGVESAQGSKLRLELKAVATTKLVDLIRAFMSR